MARELEQVSGHYSANGRPKKSSERSYDQAAAARAMHVELACRRRGRSRLLDLPVGSAGQVFGAGHDHDDHSCHDGQRDVDKEWLRHLSATQQDGILAAVQDWPGFGPPFALSILGTAGWVIAVGALALTAYRQRIPRRVWIALGLAALFLLGGHPFPAGTLAFGSFFIAAFLLEWNSHRHPELRSERGERRL